MKTVDAESLEYLQVNQWFSNVGNFAPLGILDNVWTNFSCAIGYSEWLGDTDVTKHPTMHRTAPHNKELPSPKCSIKSRLRNPELDNFTQH